MKIHLTLPHSLPYYSVNRGNVILWRPAWRWKSRKHRDNPRDKADEVYGTRGSGMGVQIAR